MKKGVSGCYWLYCVWFDVFCYELGVDVLVNMLCSVSVCLVLGRVRMECEKLISVW